MIPSEVEDRTVDPIAEELEAVRSQLTGLLNQQDTICEYLEKGV